MTTKLEIAKVIPVIIGKIWLKSGSTLSFAWYPDFFNARAFFEKTKQLVRAVHSVWSTNLGRTHDGF